MSKSSMVLRRIAGSVVGLLLGGGLTGGGLFLINALFRNSVRGPDETAGPFMVNWVLGFVPGAIVGAALGATVVQKVLRQRSSLWMALLGTLVGLPVGMFVSMPLVWALTRVVGEAGELVVVVVVPASMVAGTVIGSGWKAQPRDAAIA